MLQKLFKSYDFNFDEKIIKKFEDFLIIFKEKNDQINLSSLRDDESIIEKHFIDSLILTKFIQLSWNIADIWTWWWFPLIPLAITNPDVQFTWIDSVWKKLKAVEEFAEKLWLNNVKTLNGRAEEIWQNLDYREQFDFVTSRATAYFPTLIEYAIPLLKEGWIFIAYKLDDKEELKSAKKALSRLSAKILKVKNYKIDNQDRTIVLIEKLHKTHLKYPRKTWVPLAKPIK